MLKIYIGEVLGHPLLSVAAGCPAQEVHHKALEKNLHSQTTPFLWQAQKAF